jgi:hypothetical protein
MTVWKNDANLEALWLMEEASGTRYDDTPNNNDLTDNNTVGSSADCIEGVLSADFEQNNTEYLSIADNASLSITTDWSVFLRIKIETLDDATDHTILAKYNVTGNMRSYRVALTKDGGSYYVRCTLSNDGSATTAAIGATALSTGQWYSIACVYNQIDIRVYLDGVLDANGADNPKLYAGDIDDNASPFELGRLINVGREYDGLMDEVAVLSRELTSAEVSDLHTNGFGDQIHWLVNAIPVNSLVDGGLAR